MDLVGLDDWIYGQLGGWLEIEFVHINQFKGGAVTAAHLLKFDSVHGRRIPGIEAVSENQILIDGKPISFSEFVRPDEVQKPHKTLFYNATINA